MEPLRRERQADRRTYAKLAAAAFHPMVALLIFVPAETFDIQFGHWESFGALSGRTHHSAGNR